MTAAPSFPSLLTLFFQGREGLPWLADLAQAWSPQLDAVLLPWLGRVLAAAAKLRDQSQKPPFGLGGIGGQSPRILRGSGPQGRPGPFFSLQRPGPLSWMKNP